MLFFLHLLHFIGNSLFFSVIFFLGIQFLDGSGPVEFIFPLFFFGAIPALLLSLFTGILLVVERNYVIRNEPWLKRKGLLTLLLLMVLSLLVLPEIRQVAQGNKLEFSWPAISGIWTSWFLFLLAVAVSLRHRLQANSKF